MYFWKGNEAGSGGRHSRVLPGFPVRRCWLRRRFRLRSFSRRTGPVRWILKARTERPIASLNPSEPRRRIRISTQCSRLSIADSDGLVWTERRSANFGPWPCGSGLRAARAAPQLPGSRHCLVTPHRGVREVRCTGLSGCMRAQRMHVQNGDCLVRNCRNEIRRCRDCLRTGRFADETVQIRVCLC